MMTSVETYTGRLVDLASPDPDTIDIEDIAWHLSKIPRFVGATTHETTYSVAQHSILVMNRIRQVIPGPSRELLLSALLHDAHEAYTGDFPWPMKRLLDLRAPIERLELRLQRAIYKSLLGNDFRPLHDDPHIDEANLWARSYEAYHLMHSKGRHWSNRILLDDEHILRNMIVWGSTKAYESFRAHYESLL